MTHITDLSDRIIADIRHRQANPEGISILVPVDDIRSAADTAESHPRRLGRVLHVEALSDDFVEVVFEDRGPKEPRMA